MKKKTVKKRRRGVYRKEKKYKQRNAGEGSREEGRGETGNRGETKERKRWKKKMEVEERKWKGKERTV